MSARIVSLCTGFGALDHAVQEVVGGELVAVADTDRAASTLLGHHYPDVPNFGDITVADWSILDGADWVTAGWPCQPWSVGGLMKGALDERAIWPAVARAVRDLRPRYVLLENVPVIAAAGELARALGDLSALGFDAEWRCVSAAAVGAAHLRERIFILAAHPDRGELRLQPVSERRSSGAPFAGHAGEAVPDPEGVGHERRRSARRRGHGPADGGVPVADADRAGLEGTEPAAGRDLPARSSDTDNPWRGSWVGPNGDDHGPAIERWAGVLGRPAPAPTVLGPKGGPVLSPYFDEWLMGAPEGWITSVPGLSRADMVRMAGNGVVRQAAVAALRSMLPVLTSGAVAA